jgi:serine/threonine protein kinase
VVNYLDTGKDDTHLYIYMEAVLGGPLHLHIQHLSGIGVTNTRLYGAQLISALLHMAHQGCIHRDIKASNCVLNSRGHIKLCDFGSAVILFPPLSCGERLTQNSAVGRTYTIIGTAHAMAPEIVCRYKTAEFSSDNTSGYGLTVDWWSLGVLLQEMLFSYVPSSAQLACLHGLPLELIVQPHVAVAIPGEGENSESSSWQSLVAKCSNGICSCCNGIHQPNFFDTCAEDRRGESAVDEDSEMKSAECVIRRLLTFSIRERLGPWDESVVSFLSPYSFIFLLKVLFIRQLMDCIFFCSVNWEEIHRGSCAPVEIDRRLGFLDLFDDKICGSSRDDEVSAADQDLFQGF